MIQLSRGLDTSIPSGSARYSHRRFWTATSAEDMPPINITASNAIALTTIVLFSNSLHGTG
jgi:hypothetical protein